MISWVPPIAPHGSPPPSAFARHTMSGTTPERSIMPPGAVAKPGLHLVEREERAVTVADRAQLGEVALGRLDDADVHHHRLDDHAGDLVGILEERALDRFEVAERARRR